MGKSSQKKNNTNKRSRFSLTVRANSYGYLFIFPFIIGLLFLFLPSVVESFMNCFYNVKLNYNDISRTFVGGQNFYDAFWSDTEYRVILLNTIKGMNIDTIIIIFFSFFISNILNQKFKGRGISRTIFFLPVILSTGIIASADASAAVSSMNSVVSSGSEIQSAFAGGGIAAFFDLQDLLLSMDINSGIAETIAYAINNTYDIVNRSGVQILIFLSALQSISPSVFEAAKIEGATKWEEFWKITVPIIAPMILVNIVYTIVDSFTNPAYGLMEYVQTQGFSLNKMGYSSALSWIYFLLVLAELGVVFFLFRKQTQDI